jgi:hypothetical protein
MSLRCGRSNVLWWSFRGCETTSLYVFWMHSYSNPVPGRTSTIIKEQKKVSQNTKWIIEFWWSHIDWTSIAENTQTCWATQVVECKPGKCEALRSSPRATQYHQKNRQTKVKQKTQNTYWFNFRRSYVPRNLSMSSRFFRLLEYKFSNKAIVILWISLVCIMIVSFPPLILLRFLSLSLVSWAQDLSILLSFWRTKFFFH